MVKPSTASGEPQDRQYIAALTGMRGMAAFLVLLFHYEALHPGIRLDLAVPFIGPILQFPLGFGFSGVDIFFVLSGFLLTLPFAHAALRQAPGPGIRHYFKRRLLRVFPAYYAQLFIILAVGGWIVTWSPQTVYTMAAHLGMFFNIGWQPVTPMVGVWWTLPVEMGFYLLLPLLAPFLRPARWIPVLLGGIVLSILYRSWAASHFGEQGSDQVFLAASQLPGSLTEFLLGASAALVAQWVSLHQRPRPGAWQLDLMFVLGLVIPAIWLWHVVLGAGASYWAGHWGMLTAPTALGLPLAIAVLGLYWGSRLGARLLANRAVYFLGLISYSLYLWHFVVMQQLQLLIGDAYQDLPHWVTFPLNAAVAVAVASLSYYLVERPFYRLRSFSEIKAA
jgi:peptidoglycan/LPS O-acetylase OafA/YrhL